MLTKIKSAFTGFFAKLILIVLTASFVIVGFYGYNFRDVDTLATVDGKSVTVNEYNQTYQSILDRNRQNGEGKLPEERLNLYRQESLVSIINRKLFLNKLNQLRFTAADQDVANYIVRSPEYRTDNRFDKRKFEAFIRSQGMNREDFENSIRERLSVQNFSGVLDDLFQNNAEKMAEILLKLSKTTFTARILEFDKNFLDTPPKKSTSELSDYYDANKISYMTETGFDLKIVRYDEKDLLPTIKVNEGEIKRIFEAQKIRFSQPAGYKISRIFLPKTNPNAAYKSKAILKTLKDYPFNFEKYIRRYSQDDTYKSTKGVLPVMPYGTVPEYDAAVAEIKTIGAFAKEVIETEDGYSLIKLLELTEAREPSLDELRPLIENQLKTTAAKRKLPSFGDKIKTTVFKKLETNTDFEAIFESLGKQIFEQKNFTSKTPLANRTNARTLYYSLVEKPEGHTGFHTFDDDAIIFYKISAVHSPRQRTFEDVKDAIKQMFEDRAYDEKLDSLYADYSSSVTDTEAFDDMVKKLKAKKFVVNASFTSSGAYIKDIGASQKLKDAIKKLGGRGIGNTVAVDDTPRRFIAVLENVAPYDVSTDSEEYKNTRRNIEAQFKQMYIADTQDKLVTMQSAISTIDYHDRLINQLNIPQSQ